MTRFVFGRTGKQVKLFAQKDAAEFVFRPRCSNTGFFAIGAAQAERGKECMYKYMTDRAKTATKPSAKKPS